MFAAAAVSFGQMVSESRMAPVPSRLAQRLNAARRATAEAPKYMAASTADPDVKTALQLVLADQQRRNKNAVKMVSVLSAERQLAAGENIRLCLAIDRHGRADSARAVTHLSENNKWSVTLWAWGACK